MMGSPSRNGGEYQQLIEQETLIADAQELVCELLEAAGMSRQDLAAALGKSKGFVSQLLSGKRNMTLRTLADLATATGHRIEMSAVSRDAPKAYSKLEIGWSWHPRSLPDVAFSYRLAPLADDARSRAVPRAETTGDLMRRLSVSQRQARKRDWIPA